MSIDIVPISERTTEDLKVQAKQLDYSIHQVECYGVNDVLLLHMILTELEKRGIMAKSTLTFD